MTLVLSVNGRESIWMVADRRLSGRLTKEDGRKIMVLETNDGVAILGYAGLGLTPRRTEPSDWMSAVLRGRNLPMEQSLGEIAGAMQRQFPKHLLQLARKNLPVGHNIVIPAIVEGEPRLYSIDLMPTPDRKTYAFQYLRLRMTRGGELRGPIPFGLAGTGGVCLAQDRSWMRPLLRLVRACEEKRVPSQFVADHLASINQSVHEKTLDGSVGPRCIVAWRFNRSGIHEGGGHQSYDGLTRDANSTDIPMIAVGRDVQAIAQVFFQLVAQMNDMAQFSEIDDAEFNRELAKLPEGPDETLK